MTPEQIEKWEIEAERHADTVAGPDIARPDWYPAFLTEFARLVAADTWERAKEACESIACMHLNDAIAAANAGDTAGSERHDAIRCGAEDCEDAMEALRAAAAQEAKS